MITPLNHHYSFENPASIYDEEAMTALELAGRTTAKVNECVNEVNGIDQKVTEEYQKNLENGVFGKQLSEYASKTFADIAEVEKELYAEMAKTEDLLRAEMDEFARTDMAALSARMDTFTQLVGGSTTGDAELSDIRNDSLGKAHATAGGAVRNVHKMFTDLLIPTGENVLNPYTITAKAYTEANGEIILDFDGSSTTDLIRIPEGVTTIYANDYILNYVFYDSDKSFLKVDWEHYSVTVPASAKYFRANLRYLDGVHPVSVNPLMAKYINFNFTGWSHAPYYKPFADISKGNEATRKAYHHAMFKQGTLPISFEDCRVGGLQQMEIDGVTKGVCFGFYNQQRLQTYEPLFIPAGATISVPENYDMTLYEKVGGEYIQRVVNVKTFTAGSDCEYHFGIRKVANTAFTIEEARELFKLINVSYFDSGSGPAIPFGDFLFSMGLNDLTYMSDHTFIGNDLYVINASTDDHSTTAPVTVYGVDFERKTAYYKRTFKHNLGHANTIDYSPENDCLILGNGSSDVSLPGEVIMLTNPANRPEWRYEDCQIIALGGQNYGSKMQAVWGEHNNEQYNVIYVITNDNVNIRRLILGRNNGRFDGTFTLAGEWTGPGFDVNQGTAFYRGAIYTAVGHTALVGVKRVPLANGETLCTTMKEPVMNADGTENTAIFSEGIAIKNGYLAFGGSDGRIRFYRM